MGLDLVTGYKGYNNVTSDMWSDLNRGIWGDAAILPVGNRMAVDVNEGNQLVVKDGVAVLDGRQVYIGYGEYEDIVILSGIPGKKRNDIIVIEYTKDGATDIEDVVFSVIEGVPAASNPEDPEYEDFDIRTGVLRSQKPFCRVRVNGTVIEGIDMLIPQKNLIDAKYLEEQMMVKKYTLATGANVTSQTRLRCTRFGKDVNISGMLTVNATAGVVLLKNITSAILPEDIIDGIAYTNNGACRIMLTPSTAQLQLYGIEAEAVNVAFSLSYHIK